MKFYIPWIMASTVSMAAARPWLRSSNITYFFSFGDSYSQTGFSASGTQPSPSNPMGNPTLGSGTTTGGENWVGFLTTKENSSLILNYNLAVGGATIDNTIMEGYPDDLVSQVGVFTDNYASKPASAPWTSSSAVFGVWIGVNDVGNAFWQTDAQTFVPQLISRLGSLIQELYTSGARKFLVLNVPPTGRSPYFLDQGNATVQQHAAYLSVYNTQLKAMVDGFKANHTDVTAVLYDSWSFMTKVLDNPTEYGFPDATCINEDGTSCVWWNNYHPSAKYHELQSDDMKQVLTPLGAW
ncbi:GDSL lipase/esterase [Aspergillus ambiguus]|uniref:SGNH/GDSL hydrolase family protein n=1 Tax=Aspergillus ambiguus TaxID=176160 RepID=UPI003CCD934F